ncbi:MAG: Xaa-Pro peptidase family protein [Deltaproteobacteria bacterium]|nr:Xaa-Pro peptidase family protein [Deltaproteobacteria bacterium]
MRPDPFPVADRLKRLRSGFPETDALLILGEKNIRYLTGFTGGDGALMAGPDWLTLLVDGRFTTQARAEAQGADILEFRKRVDGITEVARLHGAKSVGFESSVLTVAEYQRLKEALPEATFAPLSSGFELLRAVKDEAEVDRIREAARIAGDALAAVRELIRPGVREEEIALELEYRMRHGGAEQISFETIVAAGANGALPHATPGRREIADGDCVTVDYGAVCGGYHSDETCTFIVGRVSERQREVYGLVLEAHDRAIEGIRAGVACGEIDRIARSHLDGAGLGSAFSHGTGHGVGLEVHEAPRLAAGRDEILQAGMVVTVEPGVYLPGLFGIRIEDTVLVTERGSEILTPTAKDLMVI